MSHHDTQQILSTAFARGKMYGSKLFKAYRNKVNCSVFSKSQEYLSLGLLGIAYLILIMDSKKSH